MTDLFDEIGQLQPLNLPGADVSYQPKFDLGLPPSELLRKLIEETPWRQENVTVWGRTFRQPRLVAWYGDLGKSYRYSGIALEPLPWTERIQGVRARVEGAVSYKFN